MLAAGVGGQSERLAGRRRKMAVESRVTQEEIKKEPEKPIDREKVSVGRGGGASGRAQAAGRGGKGPPPDSRPPPPDLPAAAARLHHQQRPPPPHGRVLPRKRAVQRAADLHLVRRGSGARPGVAGTRAGGEGREAARGCPPGAGGLSSRLRPLPARGL